MPASYKVVDEATAQQVKQGTLSLWFVRLLEGAMLDMTLRPQLTKGQLAASEGYRLRTKQHAIDEETGYRFYVWLEPLETTDEADASDEDEPPIPDEGDEPPI